MAYISSIINDDYKKWNNIRGEKRIFISSHTGSGKTYFILHILLAFLSKRESKILYLVNRRILKEQIKKVLEKIPSEMALMVEIELYQDIENKICKKEDEYNFEERIQQNQSFMYQEIGKLYDCYDYVICDECHYFLSDSNFNTNTALSFRFIQEQFSNKVRIFMSATIEDIKSFIKEYEQKRKYHTTYHYNILYNARDRMMYERDREECMFEQNVEEDKIKKDYVMDKDYSYIQINILKDKKQIADTVKEKKDSGKWFIFIDSISFGENLKKSLAKEFGKDNVVMISSEYRIDEKAMETVNEIVTENKAKKAKIIISTSVMDNGIDLKDRELNHFIIVADTEVEFIQMLGRKREDNQILDLYILGQDKNYFVRRKQWVMERLNIAREYKHVFEGLKEQRLKSVSPEMEGEFYDNYENHEMKLKKDKQERDLIEKEHIKLMRKISNNTIKYDHIKSMFIVYGGKLYLNPLSFYNLEKLNMYYQRMIEKFDEDKENAFLKEQLRWLGKIDEADEIIAESKINRAKNAYEYIENKICTILGKHLSKEEAIKFKNEIKEKLLDIIALAPDSKEKEKYIRETKKPDRPISHKAMEYFNVNCNLHYEMIVKKTYTIQKVTVLFENEIVEKN